MHHALDKIRVLDLTRLLPGAVATMLLADMGAEVIKIEAPGGGDYARWAPPLQDGLGALFRTSNRNKKSVVLNLKANEGQAILHRLVRDADVVVEGFRPGVAARLRCDFPSLQPINPRLVMASLSGWGQDGPYAHRSGHDLNYLARSGFLGTQRAALPLGGQVADIGGAYLAVMGITTALFQRERRGEGAFVDVSLMEAAMPFALQAWTEALVGGVGPGQGVLTGGAAFYEVYQSSDGQPMAFAPMEPKFWANFCHAIDRPDLLDHHTDPNRQAELRQFLTELFLTKTAAEWDALLTPADCCFSLVTPPAELGDDPQLQARGMLDQQDDGSYWMRSPLVRGEITPTPAPGYGEHTREILSAAGYDDATLKDWHERGIIQV